MSLNETCIEVLQSQIAEFELEDAIFTLIEHTVGINWRNKYTSTKKRLDHVDEGLIHLTPIQTLTIKGEDILSSSFSPSDLIKEKNRVISICSKVKLDNNQYRHLPQMNLHPEASLSVDDVVKVVNSLTENMVGYLMKSGRYLHYYGFGLFDEAQWLRFLAQFLMPTIIVSPRYIGHSLYRGYTALRITVDEKYKPILPKAICLTGILKE